MADPIVEALHAHERALQFARTGESFDARMRTAIAGHRSHSSTWPWAVAASLLAVAVAVGLFRVLAVGEVPGDPPPQAVSRLAGAPLGGQECRRDFEGGKIVLDGRCRVEIEGPGVTVETWTRAFIEPRADGLIVHDGLVLVDVDEVRAGSPPVRVGVAGGTIEVLGTQFVVYQGGAGGEVELMEGKIRFARATGEVVEMHVGDRLRWSPPAKEAVAIESPALEVGPEAVEVQPRKVPPPPRRRRPVESGTHAASEPVDVNAALAEVARLRAARRFDAALEKIETLRRGSHLPNAVAELLSFEQGTLLEAKGADDAACSHWGRHASRFPAGRYASEVVRHRQQLACVPG